MGDYVDSELEQLQRMIEELRAVVSEVGEQAGDPALDQRINEFRSEAVEIARQVSSRLLSISTIGRGLQGDVSNLHSLQDSVSPYLVDRVVETKSGYVVQVEPPYEISRRLALQADIDSGEDLTEARPTEVYLDTDNEEIAKRVFAAVDRFNAVIGQESPAEVKITRGSFFRRSTAWIKQAFSSDEFKDRLVKMERAFELYGIEQRQAEVDEKSASALSQIIQSLEELPNASIRSGSFLILKYELPNGRPALVVRQLSQLEVRAWERFPALQISEPTQVLSQLAVAVAALEDPVQGPSGA